MQTAAVWGVPKLYDLMHSLLGTYPKTSRAMSRNLTELSHRQGLDNNLFERIGKLASPQGTPDPAAMQALAEEFLFGPANIFGTASFYDFTRPENQGKQVYVCSGTACQMAGTQPQLREQLEQHFPPAAIGEMCCLGRCHENAAFHCEGRNFSGRDIEDLPEILAGTYLPEPDSYLVEHVGKPILTAPMPATNVYLTVIREMLERSAEGVLYAVESSGLRGRGGAGYPTGTKMRACAEAPGDEKYVVINADEGDPGAYSDRYLLEHRSLLVLLGTLIAAYGIGARKAVIYLRAEYPEAASILEESIADLRQKGVLGQGILGSTFAMDIKVIRAQGAYICGEETALLASIEGQRPEVRLRPPYPAQAGLFNKPTLVVNVETVANLYTIMANGPDAFAKVGTPESRGTKLFSLDSAFNRPGVYEVEMGTPLATVVEDLGGHFCEPVKALHIGGPLGGLVPLWKVPELNVEFESFARQGFLLGHASIVCVPERVAMIDYLEDLFAFAAHESCGKCFPCRLGTVRGRELLQQAREGKELIDPVLWQDLLETLEVGSLCGLGSGLPLPVRNALMYFSAELAPYFEAGKMEEV